MVAHVLQIPNVLKATVRTAQELVISIQHSIAAIDPVFRHQIRTGVQSFLYKLRGKLLHCVKYFRIYMASARKCLIGSSMLVNGPDT